MSKDYVVKVIFPSREDAQSFERMLARWEAFGDDFRGSYGSPEPYEPFYHIVDIIEEAYLRFVRLFRKGV